MVQKSGFHQLRLVVLFLLFFAGFFLHPRWLAGFLNHQRYPKLFAEMYPAWWGCMRASQRRFEASRSCQMYFPIFPILEAGPAAIQDIQAIQILGGGFTYVLCSLLLGGRFPVWLYNMFQGGWNHQLGFVSRVLGLFMEKRNSQTPLNLLIPMGALEDVFLFSISSAS